MRMNDISAAKLGDITNRYGDDAMDFLDAFDLGNQNIDIFGSESRTPCCVLNLNEKDVPLLVQRLKLLFPDMENRKGSVAMWYIDATQMHGDWIVNMGGRIPTYDHMFYLEKFCVTHPE